MREARTACAIDSAKFSGAKTADRYELHDEFAAGGMATVHLGRLFGRVGFARTVAIKRMLGHLVHDESARAMFMDEARLAARIRHPNVVSVIDVISNDGELWLVMEYVHGPSLSRLQNILWEAGQRIPLWVAGAIVSGMLQGLHAAHEAKDERRRPLNLVHRDVSPQNILVGLDGIPRLTDFGVARAAGRVTSTRHGEVKGKLAYMAPEQALGDSVNHLCDIWGAGVVLWELVANRRLFKSTADAPLLYEVLEREIKPPSAFCEGLPAAVDAVVMKALQRSSDQRFASAFEMGDALEHALAIGTSRELASWVNQIDLEELAERLALIEAIETSEAPAMARLASMPPLEAVGASAKTPVQHEARARQHRFWLPLSITLTACAIGAFAWFLAARAGRPSVERDTGMVPGARELGSAAAQRSAPDTTFQPPFSSHAPPLPDAAASTPPETVRVQPKSLSQPRSVATAKPPEKTEPQEPIYSRQ